MSETLIEEEKVDETEILEPNYSTNYVTFGEGDAEITFVQKPLTFFGKMELFSLLGESVNKAMKEGELSLFDIFDVPEQGLSMNTSDLKEADLFIKAISIILGYAPDFLKDLYCVALHVPKGEREYVKMLMDDPGISDEVALQIMDIFIEQNWEAIYDFFTKKLSPIIKKITSKGRDIPLSKPLNRSQRRTQKQ